MEIKKVKQKRNTYLFFNASIPTGLDVIALCFFNVFFDLLPLFLNIGHVIFNKLYKKHAVIPHFNMYICMYVCVCVCVFWFLYLKGISAFVGYLMQKPSLQKDSSGTIQPIARGGG